MSSQIETLRAFADHGNIERALGADLDATEAVLAAAAADGLDLETIALELEREGVKAFCDSYKQLLSIESKLGSLMATPGAGARNGRPEGIPGRAFP